jgi:outer membrane protein TolC
MCAVVVLAALAGCDGGLRDIDARTDAVLRERLDEVGGLGGKSSNRLVDRTRLDPDDVTRSAAQVEPRPSSTNPAAEALTFVPAAESRNVAERLGAMHNEPTEGAIKLTLEDAFRQAQSGARELLSAEEDYLIAAIQLLIQRHAFDWRPIAETRLSGTRASTDGSRQLTLGLLNQLGVTRQLRGGGRVAASWVWEASENLRAAASGGYVQSSRLVLSGEVPLLRGAGDVAQEGLIQSERNLVYAARNFETFRRQFLVSIARDYFSLLRAQDGIISQRRQLESLQDLEKRQRAWYESGLLREFEVNLARNNVLQAQAGLTNLRESYQIQLDRFKVRLGIGVRTPVVIEAAEFQLPEPETTLDDSARLALEYRLELQNRRDQLEDARRQVVNAKNELLPDLNLAGSATLPTDPGAREGGAVYTFDTMTLEGSATFSLPLDRRVERLELRQTLIRLEQQARGLDEFRDELVLDVRARTREIERSRLNLDLAEARVKINLRTKEEQTLKPDEVTTREQVDAANELREAELSRDAARADLRNAVLEYLLATGQLRVRRDGTFEELPGMNVAPATERMPAPSSSPAPSAIAP